MRANISRTTNDICKLIIESCTDYIDVEFSLHLGEDQDGQSSSNSTSDCVQFQAYSCRSVFATSIARLVSRCACFRYLHDPA